MSEDLLSVSTQLQMNAQHQGPAQMFEELHTDLHLNTIASPPQTPFGEEWLIHTFFLSASHHHHHHHNPPTQLWTPNPNLTSFPLLWRKHKRWLPRQLGRQGGCVNHIKETACGTVNNLCGTTGDWVKGVCVFGVCVSRRTLMQLYWPDCWDSWSADNKRGYLQHDTTKSGSIHLSSSAQGTNHPTATAQLRSILSSDNKLIYLKSADETSGQYRWFLIRFWTKLNFIWRAQIIWLLIGCSFLYICTFWSSFASQINGLWLLSHSRLQEFILDKVL